MKRMFLELIPSVSFAATWLKHRKMNFPYTQGFGRQYSVISFD